MSANRREVILGVGAGIAAYKSADLLRRLHDRGYYVTVVPTPSSLNFVGAATWEALSGRPALTQVWESVHQVAHISLAKNAGFFIIAPATADLIARIAVGRADDLLTNLVLSSDVAKMIVPAMHPNMWNNAATKANVETLRARGFIIMEPDTGRLTGSDSGQGRFPEVSRIVEEFDSMTGNTQDFTGRKILIAAGGTREAIDPVRFIGNRSSGKQGISLARAAQLRGADVYLVAANMDTSTLDGISITHVESAREMQQALQRDFPSSDVLIMCAAVADARPVQTLADKIKKALFTSIELEPNPDLLAELASTKVQQVLIGFAAETKDHLESARAKLKAKALDIIYVNDVSNGAIFGKDVTHGTILLRNGEEIALKEVSKDALADLLLDHAKRQLG